MGTQHYWLGTLALLALGCQGSGGSMALRENNGSSTGTGLEGTMRRGPIQPVCQVEVPCDGSCLQREIELPVEAEALVQKFLISDGKDCDEYRRETPRYPAHA